MGKKQYVIESDFEDLHGNDDDPTDLELDLSDSDNPIITAALSDEDWVPPEDDDDKDDDDDPDDSDDDDDDDLDDPDDGDEEEDEDDDDDGEDDSDDDDDDEEEEEDKYSKNVQKRIDRERDARRRDKVTSDRKIAKLERQAKHRDARDEFAEEERGAESKLRKLRKKKIAAKEEGDTTSEVDIDDEILDIKADIKSKQFELKRLKEEIDNDDDISTDTGTPEEGRKWLEKYPQFHTNKTFRDVVLQADKMVAARHLDKNTPEYYQEMEKILKPQFPEIIKIVKVTTKRKRKTNKKRSAVGSTTRSGTRRKTRNKTRGGRIRLTKADQKNMEIFGLDPTNPEDLKEFAANKVS